MNYKIIGKYVKDLIFKIPNSKTFFYLSKEISNYKINIDIKSNFFKEKIIEVETTLSLIPRNKDFEKIESLIVYSAIVEIDGDLALKKEIEEIILIKIPSETYQDIRKIFVSNFELSGFKDVKIDKEVDFKKLYNLRKIQ